MKPERMFAAMFALMFGVFTFAQAFEHLQDKEKAMENARSMFELIETPSKIDIDDAKQNEKQ